MWEHVALGTTVVQAVHMRKTSSVTPIRVETISSGRTECLSTKHQFERPVHQQRYRRLLACTIGMCANCIEKHPADETIGSANTNDGRPGTAEVPASRVKGVDKVVYKQHTAFPARRSISSFACRLALPRFVSDECFHGEYRGDSNGEN